MVPATSRFNLHPRCWSADNVTYLNYIPFSMVLRKDELEIQLKDEHQLIKDGVLRDDSPLDTSDDFNRLCDACRRGDLKDCHEMIAGGVNINARDIFDYTPLILVRFAA